MKITQRTYRLLILFCLAIFTTATAVSQTMTQQDPSPEVEEVAREKVEMWEEELGLTAKQMSLMEEKIIEYAIKKDRVLQSKMHEEAKSRSLIRLQESEDGDMRNILTKPQFDRYLLLQRRMTREQGVEN